MKKSNYVQYILKQKIVILNYWKNKVFLGSFGIKYHVDFKKRGGCGVVARERHDSHIS